MSRCSATLTGAFGMHTDLMRAHRPTASRAPGRATGVPPRCQPTTAGPECAGLAPAHLRTAGISVGVALCESLRPMASLLSRKINRRSRMQARAA